MKLSPNLNFGIYLLLLALMSTLKEKKRYKKNLWGNYKIVFFSIKKKYTSCYLERCLSS